MKIYIATDLEGVCCVVGEPQKTLTESKQYQFAREQLTKLLVAANETIRNGPENIVPGKQSR